jgi:hypothetical protein
LHEALTVRAVFPSIEAFEDDSVVRQVHDGTGACAGDELALS